MTRHDHDPADIAGMRRAIANAATVQGSTAPNPGVGALVRGGDGAEFDGATEPPGGRHAERVALDAAHGAARGATVYSTLEPCCFTGRTGPCTDALIDAGVARVVIGLVDPDSNVAGRGVEQLRAAGIEVVSGVCADEVGRQLRPYLHHRRTGRPWVVLKMATTLDGRTAAPDASSRWITGPDARADVHRLRARCDSILVGAGTIRDDDPALTVRDAEGTDPRRFVLGKAPPDARVHPCTEVSGDLGVVLDGLGEDGVVDLLVEGGATVAAAFHRAGLVDEYVFYVAPALMGGDDGRPVFAGAGAPTMSAMWRGRIESVDAIGSDVRIVMLGTPEFEGAAEPPGPHGAERKR